MTDERAQGVDDYRSRARARDVEARSGLPTQGRPLPAGEPPSGDGRDPIDTRHEARAPSRSSWRWKLLLAGVLVVAALWPIVGSAKVFPNLTRNADEVVWLAQAEVLESGKVSAPAPPAYARNFEPWFASIRDGRYVYRYPPLFPAVLAASDVVTGTPRIALGAVSAWAILAVYLLAAELLRRRGPALLAAVLVGVSPIYFLTAAMFLGYVFFLALICTAAWLLARGVRQDRWPDLVLAGLTFGLAVFHRPYDALLLGLPWAVWLVWRSRRRALRLSVLVAVGALPVIVGMLLYNWHLTGDALKQPFVLWDPTDTVGFGRHFASLPPQPVDFTVVKGIVGVGHFWEDLFSWTVLGLPVAAVATLVFVRRARIPLAPLTGMIVTLTLGWVAFFASYYRPFRVQAGPIYFLPVLVPLAVLTAAGATAVMRVVRSRAQRLVVWGLGCLVLGLTLTLGAVHVVAWDHVRRITAPGLPEATMPTPSEVVRATRPIGRTPAIVFLPYPFVGFVPPLHNPPELDGTRLYAVESGAEDAAIARAHPDLRPYQLVLQADGSVRLQPLR